MRQRQNYQWMQRLNRIFQRYWLPLLLGIVTTIAVLGTWQQLIAYEQLHVQQLVQQEANAIELELNREVSVRISALERMASRWHMSGGTPQTLWEADAAQHMNYFYGYQALEWVDPSFHVRWVVPTEGSETIQNLDLGQESRRQITLSIARDLRQTILTRTISLAQGGKGFLVCVPLFVDNSANGAQGVRPDGFIVGVFRFQSLLDSILKASPRYRVQIYDRAELVYSQGTPPRFMPPATVDIHSYGADWQVQVFATAALIESGRSLLPTLVLWGGLVGAWILAFIVILGQRSELYSRRARTMNHQLQEEIIHRQQVEASLRESEERLQFAFQASGEGWWDWDITAGQVKRSPEYLKLLGYEVGEFPDVVDSWEASIHPDDFPHVMKQLTTHLQAGFVPYTYDYRVLTKSGRWHWVADYGMVVTRDANNQPQRMIGMFKDINDRKQIELALQKELVRSTMLFNTSMDGIVVLNHQGNVVQASPSFAKMIGYTAEEILQLNVADWDTQWTKEELALMREEGMIPLFETQHRRKDGSRYDVEISCSRIELEGERIDFCICRDISDRKAAEAALEESQQRYQNLIENSPDIIERFDLQLRHLYVNPAITQITGIAPEDFLGKTCRDLDMDEAMVNTWERAAATLLKTGQKQVIEFSIPNLQGVRSFEMAIAPEWSDQQTIESILCISRDITARKHAEQALRQSEATKQAIIQAIPDLLVRMRSDGSYVECISNSAFNLVGSTHYLNDTNVLETLPLHLAQQQLHNIQQAVRSGRLQIYEHEIVINGEQSYEEVRIVPLVQDEVLVMVRDITHHKRAEMALKLSEERLQLALEASGDGLWDWSMATGDIYLSSRYQEMLGYLPGELVMDLDVWEHMIHPDDRPSVLERLQAHLNDDTVGYALDYRVKCRSNEWMWIADYGKVVARDAEGNPLRMIGTHKDISDRKCQEFALRQAMEAAEAANLAKSTFLANMSHELRTPLNVILGFAQVMAHDPSLTPNQQDDLQTIRRSGDHLLSLINDVLDLSKIEAGHSNLEEDRFDLRALLHTLYTMMTERANSKQIQLELEIPPELPQFVIADEQKLRQVLLNLLSNAIKFTERGSVTLSVSFALERSQDRLPDPDQRTTEPQITLRFNITDTGVGIADDEQPSIFDAFVQAEAGKRSVSGTGLGLTISRKLVELMHGEISVQSIASVGSTFTVTVPVCPTSESQSKLESRDCLFSLVPGQPRHRILVVDDHSENRLLLVRLLAQLGLEVKEVTNGKDAIRIWRDWRPDLIWMDIRMPEIDGYETTKQIRALEQEHHTIIIALTAHASQSDRTLALAAGCNDYISKPFRAELLFQKLKEYLGLEYLYAESTVSPDPQSVQALSEDAAKVLTPTLPALLSSEWLYSLEAAAICGSDRAIVELVTQLPPSFDRLSKQLTELAEKYQFEQILQLLHDSSLL